MQTLEGLNFIHSSEMMEVAILFRIVKSASLVFDLREGTLGLPDEHV